MLTASRAPITPGCNAPALISCCCCTCPSLASPPACVRHASEAYTTTQLLLLLLPAHVCRQAPVQAGHCRQDLDLEALHLLLVKVLSQRHVPAFANRQAQTAHTQAGSGAHKMPYSYRLHLLLIKVLSQRHVPGQADTRHTQAVRQIVSHSAPACPMRQRHVPASANTCMLKQHAHRQAQAAHKMPCRYRLHLPWSKSWVSGMSLDSRRNTQPQAALDSSHAVTGYTHAAGTHAGGQNAHSKKNSGRQRSRM